MSDRPEDDDSEFSETEPEPVETRDLTDPKKERQHRDRLKREAQETASLIRSIMNDKVGRRWMWRKIAVEAHAFNTEFACGPNGFPQTQATWYAFGQQQLGLKNYQELMMAVDPEYIRLMHSENDPRFIELKAQRKAPD